MAGGEKDQSPSVRHNNAHSASSRVSSRLGIHSQTHRVGSLRPRRIPPRFGIPKPVPIEADPCVRGIPSQFGFTGRSYREPRSVDQRLLPCNPGTGIQPLAKVVVSPQGRFAVRCGSLVAPLTSHLTISARTVWHNLSTRRSGVLSRARVAV